MLDLLSPQLGEATLFAAGLALMEACIKSLTASHSFDTQVLSSINTRMQLGC